MKIVSRRVDCSREENLLRACQRHANVVKLIDVHHDRLHTYIVMELLSGGELLQRTRPFAERQAKRVMRQLASAVRYMHSRGVVHRDLKPENIVYVHQGEDSSVKIVDFGFARMKNSCEPLHTPCFTFPYAAPEVVANQEYDESCDMWSLGTILYFMLSDNPPFRTDTPNVAMRIKAGEINFDSEAWSHVSAGAKQVMKGLLMIDPNNRLTAASLVYHSWLTMHDTTIFPVTPTTDTVHADSAVAASSTSIHEREGFRLRAVDAAKLAQRRKHKRSNSSSSTSRPSSSSSSSPSSVQLLQLPSATASAANTSTSSPSVFDFNDEVVNEYLSSLSSSSDSNSSIRLSLLQGLERTAKKRVKRNVGHESSSKQITKKHRHQRDDSEASGSSSSGPMTRSRKRKLEQIVNSDRDIGSDNSAESFELSSQTTHDEEDVHRRHKTSKRPKRLATIIVE